MAMTGTKEVKIHDIVAWAESNNLLSDDDFSSRDAQDFLVTVFKHMENFGTAKVQDD